MFTTPSTRAVTRVLAALGLTLALAPSAHAAGFGPWSPAINAETVPGTSDQLNTQYQDGCPMQSPDGLSLYMASNRPRIPGGLPGDLDIWVAQRASTRDPWGPPENLGAPVNSASDDFCPTPVRGGGLFFVSRKVTPGVTCGMGDIYFARQHPRGEWSEPQHLGCGTEGGPNGPADEQGPSFVEAGGPQLYFSSGPDIFVSRQGGDGQFGPAVRVDEVNSTTAVDIQPNVRKDGREMVFASTRKAGVGQDLWSATREDVDDPWSEPVNLAEVNTPDNETRPSLSWDGETLYFGRGPAVGGPADIYVAERDREHGNGR